MPQKDQVNILRTAVGIRDMAHLSELQTHFRTKDYDGQSVVVATTRRAPRQSDDIIATGGSVYWIIKNVIQARQKIVDLTLVEEADGSKFCQILMEPQIIRTQTRKKRAIQGWRYLKGADAPEDIGPFNPSDDSLPPEMEEELRALGIV